MSESRSACSTILAKALTFKSFSILRLVFGSFPKFGFATILFIRFSIISSFSSLLNSSGGRDFLGGNSLGLPPAIFASSPLETLFSSFIKALRMISSTSCCFGLLGETSLSPLAISPSCFSSQNLISYARVSALIIYAI
jgi:hypothetical protein